MALKQIIFEVKTDKIVKSQAAFEYLYFVSEWMPKKANNIFFNHPNSKAFINMIIAGDLRFDNSNGTNICPLQLVLNIFKKESVYENFSFLKNSKIENLFLMVKQNTRQADELIKIIQIYNELLKPCDSKFEYILTTENILSSFDLIQEQEIKPSELYHLITFFGIFVNRSTQSQFEKLLKFMQESDIDLLFTILLGFTNGSHLLAGLEILYEFFHFGEEISDNHSPNKNFITERFSVFPKNIHRLISISEIEAYGLQNFDENITRKIKLRANKILVEFFE